MFGRTKAMLSSRYRLHQKLNKQLMRSELEAIEEVVNDSKIRDISEKEGSDLVSRKTYEKARRMIGITRNREVNPDKVRKYSIGVSETTTTGIGPSSTEFNDYSAVVKPDRLSSFQSLKKSPEYNDLTHAEARRVQELFEKKRMLNRKIQWLKNNHLLDPERVVDKEMKRKEKNEFFESSDQMSTGSVMYPPPFSNEVDPVMDKRVKQLEFKMERDTKISRLRTETRKEKLGNSKVMKMASPTIGNMLTDPLKRHLQRRRVRVSLLLHQYLEEFLSCNTAQVLIDHLGGASISVERVMAPSTRGVHDVFVRVTSNHEKDWVQKQLEILAPKLRSQLAVRVNYGYTPELKFHVIDDISKFNKNRLMKMVDEVKLEVDRSLSQRFIKEMNWK